MTMSLFFVLLGLVTNKDRKSSFLPKKTNWQVRVISLYVPNVNEYHKHSKITEALMTSIFLAFEMDRFMKYH